ncbi:hypothetical protein [Bacillus sp. J37]|nr:hypothetical protein [Bacillus sp. J37]
MKKQVNLRVEKELTLRDKEHQPETEKEVYKQLDACLLTSDEFDLEVF